MIFVHSALRLLVTGGAIYLYLYLQLLGYGLTRLVLRDRLLSRQIWLAQWFGLMLTVIPLFCLSWIGISTGRAFYFITLIGASLALVALASRKPFLAPLDRFDRWLAAGALATYAIAIYPMLSLPNVPTTMSLGNNDPALYAIASDYLISHTLSQLPPNDARHPNTVLVDGLPTPGHRPGAFLVLSLFDSLFHAPSYRVFSVLLAVLLALTTPLVAIFAYLMSAKRCCGLIALCLSFANVNVLFCYYHGFAAQDIVLGCIIASFILLLGDEHEASPPISHSIAAGIAMITMVMLAPEGAMFFIGPYLLFAAMQAVSRARPLHELIRRYGVANAVLLIAGIFPLWQGALWLHRVSSIRVGWKIPNWALPVHLLGLVSAVGRPRSILITGILSIPIVAAIIWGIARSRDRLFIAALLGFNVAVLVYFGAVRPYSYAYYKASVMATFVVIAAFSNGLPHQLYRFPSAACAALAILSFIICRPIISGMTHLPLAVRPGLSALSKIAPRLIQGEIISLDNLSLWDTLWAVDFILDAALTAHGTLFTPQKPTLILLPRMSRDGTRTAQGDADVLWSSDQFLLVGAKRR